MRVRKRLLRILAAPCLGALLAVTFFTGCGKQDENADEKAVLDLIKSHVEANKDRPEFNWIVNFPRRVRINEEKSDPNLTHWAKVSVFGKETTMPNSNRPAIKQGYFIVGKEKKTGKWVITSGEVPKDVKYRPL